MSWQLLVGLSVSLFSLNGLFHRVVMRDVRSDPFAQTIVFYGLGGFFAFIIALFRGGFHYHISLNQLPFFVLITLFATIAPVLNFKAAKSLEASESSILLSSQKLWEVILAFIVLQEVFSLHRLLGTVVVLSGITLAQWRRKQFVINQGIIFALLAALSYASTEITSYYVLRGFDAPSFNVYAALLPVITLFCIKPQTYKKVTFYFKPQYLVNIVVVSFTATLASLFLYSAYQLGRNASQIAPIMAAETILTVLLAILLLQERSNMLQKISGAVIVVMGVLLLF